MDAAHGSLAFRRFRSACLMIHLHAGLISDAQFSMSAVATPALSFSISLMKLATDF